VSTTAKRSKLCIKPPKLAGIDRKAGLGRRKGRLLDASAYSGDRSVDHDVRQSSHLAAQQIVGILSQRGDRGRTFDSRDFVSFGVAVDT